MFLQNVSHVDFKRDKTFAGLEFTGSTEGFPLTGVTGLPGLWPLAFLGIVEYSAMMLLKYDLCKSDMSLHVIVN